MTMEGCGTNIFLVLHGGLQLELLVFDGVEATAAPTIVGRDINCSR